MSKYKVNEIIVDTEYDLLMYIRDNIQYTEDEYCKSLNEVCDPVLILNTQFKVGDVLRSVDYDKFKSIQEQKIYLNILQDM